MTDKDFRTSGFRDQLFAFLNTECGKLAFEVLERKASELPNINGIHHTDAVVARMYAFDAGINKALKSLKSLAEPWVGPTDLEKATTRPEFADSIPPNLREAYEKYLNQNPQA